MCSNEKIENDSFDCSVCDILDHVTIACYPSLDYVLNLLIAVVICLRPKVRLQITTVSTYNLVFNLTIVTCNINRGSKLLIEINIKI